MVMLLVAILFLSPYARYKLKRISAKAEMTLSKWNNREPRLISIVGESGLPGAQVQVLDSRSGWAALCDSEGRFVLPGVTWYSGATYDLIFSTGDQKGRSVRISVPCEPPAEAIIDIGRINPELGYEVDLYDLPGISSVTYEGYDFRNRDYYRELFDRLTEGKISDEERIDAVNRYIAEKLNYRETAWELGSPRRILERGSQYCGHLGTAMAAVLAVAYPTRVIHLSDREAVPNTHAVVEVYYRGKWHLYDPTYGVRFKSRESNVASYRDVRLDTSLIAQDLFSDFRRKYPKISLGWMQGVYGSGYHHYYVWSFACSQFSHTWWDYPDGRDYVPRGGRILLAAAGIRPGTTVTYHIREEGKNDDALVLTTRGKSNSACILNQEESPPIDLPPGTYNVFVDLEDGNVSGSDPVPARITNWRLRAKLKVK